MVAPSIGPNLHLFGENGDVTIQVKIIKRDVKNKQQANK